MHQKRFKNRPTAHTFSLYRRERTNQRRIEKTMNLIRNYRNWRLYRDTVSELNSLTNRELQDLGIARRDIREVARKAI